MRILIFGKGYVSRKMQMALLKYDLQPEVYQGPRIDKYTKDLALWIPQTPDLIINCAGYTGYPNVDDCEDHISETFLSNAFLPAKIGEYCKANGVQLIHFSTGCMFQGDEFHKETNQPNNLDTVYTLSKYAGEKLLGWNQTYILRIRMPFSADFNSKNLLTKLENYPKIINAVNSITWLEEACEIGLKLWKKAAPFGAYNVVCDGARSNKEIVELLGFRNKEFFSSFDEFNQTVKVPRSFTTLSIEKLKAEGIAVTPVHDALLKVISQREDLRV